MKSRLFAVALTMSVAVSLMVLPVLSGCADSQAKNSNTDSVENPKPGEEGRTVPEEQSTVYASMSVIRAAVIEILGEKYWPDKQLSEEEFEVETNITKDMYEEFFAEKQNVESDIDMMIIVRAKQDKISEVEGKLNEYRDALMVKYKDRPRELGKVEASRIETIDRYVCFVQLGADTEAAAKSGDEAVIALCQQDNEQAVDVIEKTILE